MAAPPPPGDGSRATALVNAPDGPADTGAAPAQPSEFDFIYNSPIYKFQKLQQAKAYAENERQQRMDNLVGGFGKIIGAATGRGGGGGGGVKVRGDISEDPTLTYAELADLQKQATTAQADARLSRVIDVIAQRRGWDRAQLEGIRLTHPETFAKLNFNTLDEKALAEAEKAILEIAQTEAQTNKINVEAKKIGGVDTRLGEANILQSDAAAEASRAQAAKDRQATQIAGDVAPVDLATKQLGVKKAEQELTPDAIYDPVLLAEVAKSMDTTPEVLRAQSKPDLAKVVRDFIVKREEARGGKLIDVAATEYKTATDANTAAVQGMTRRAQARDLIEKGVGVTGGYLGAEYEQMARTFAQKLGWNYGDQAVQTQALNAILAGETLKLSETMKGSLSDPDRQFLQEASGADYQWSADSRSRMFAMRDLLARKEIEANNARIERAQKTTRMEPLPSDRAQPLSISRGEMQYLDNQSLASALTSEAGRRNIEIMYGKGVADDIAANSDRWVASKFHTKDPYNDSYTVPDTGFASRVLRMSPDDLKKNKAIIEDHATLYGNSGVGLYELLLARAEKSNGPNR